MGLMEKCSWMNHFICQVNLSMNKQMQWWFSLWFSSYIITNITMISMLCNIEVKLSWLPENQDYCFVTLGQSEAPKFNEDLEFSESSEDLEDSSSCL